jgi:[ribosomal protein S18]-alanine N-acetyltransferase
VEEISLRKATEDDLEAIAALEKAVQLSPWDQGAFQEELDLPLGNILILTDDETDSKLFGYVVYRSFFEEWEILNLGVHPDIRRKGFGETLLRAVVNQGMREGARKIFLEVRVSNDSAVQLYQKLGFTIRYVRKNYYSDGENGYVMELSLEQEGFEF